MITLVPEIRVYEDLINCLFLIIGKNGFLGKSITRTCQLSKINYFSFSRENWEYFLKHDPSKWLKNNGVKTIIFAAGYKEI